MKNENIKMIREKFQPVPSICQVILHEVAWREGTVQKYCQFMFRSQTRPKYFRRYLKMLLLKTVIIFYINAIFTLFTVIPTHILSLLIEMPLMLYKNTSYRA